MPLREQELSQESECVLARSRSPAPGHAGRLIVLSSDLVILSLSSFVVPALPSLRLPPCTSSFLISFVVDQIGSIVCCLRRGERTQEAKKSSSRRKKKKQTKTETLLQTPEQQVQPDNNKSRPKDASHEKMTVWRRFPSGPNMSVLLTTWRPFPRLT